MNPNKENLDCGFKSNAGRSSGSWFPGFLLQSSAFVFRRTGPHKFEIRRNFRLPDGKSALYLAPILSSHTFTS
jgi:hypothetical protein